MDKISELKNEIKKLEQKIRVAIKYAKDIERTTDNIKESNEYYQYMRGARKVALDINKVLEGD